MPDPLHAEPFHADGAPGGPGAGVLLVHGFTSTPASMTPWAEHLAADGFRVWQNMNQTGWRDWYAEVLRAFVELRGHGEPVFVAGLSMGGGLALRLAEERPDDVAGLMLVNPSLLDPDKRLIATPLLKRLTGSVAGIKSDIKKPGVGEEGYDRVPLKALDSLRELWRMTRADLRKITAPVLVFRSAVDHVVPALSSQVVIQEVGSADVSEQVLAESYHVAVLDNDAPQIFAESAAFARRVLGAGVGAGDAL